MFEQRRRAVAPPSLRTGTDEAATARQAGRRKPRHSGLFEAIARLDLHLDAASREDLCAWIREEYRTQYEAIPIGFVSACHLGPPFVDHRLDLGGSIVEHYAPHESMPWPFDDARLLARTGACAFVEVFSDGEVVAIGDDGSPA